MKSVKFYNYDVYEDGRVYSYYWNKFLIGDITKQGYLQYTLSINGKRIRIKAHQLVATLFIGKPVSDTDLIVNHKDGNKLNNHYSNLEWVTYYENNLHARENNLNNISLSNHNRWNDKEWASKTASNISKGKISSGASKGENNPMFRYKIFDAKGKRYDRIELSKELGLSLSYTDTIIRKLSKHIVINNEKIKNLGIYIIDTKTH